MQMGERREVAARSSAHTNARDPFHWLRWSLSQPLQLAQQAAKGPVHVWPSRTPWALTKKRKPCKSHAANGRKMFRSKSSRPVGQKPSGFPEALHPGMSVCFPNARDTAEERKDSALASQQEDEIETRLPSDGRSKEGKGRPRGANVAVFVVTPGCLANLSGRLRFWKEVTEAAAVFRRRLAYGRGDRRASDRGVYCLVQCLLPFCANVFSLKRGNQYPG